MPPRPSQGSFAFTPQFQPRREHGGDERAGRRKLHRPLQPGLNHHVVLRSSRARGAWSFLHRRNRSRVERTIFTQAERHGVTVDRLANVGNHLHVLARFKTAEGFRRFLKAIGGLIARQVTGARKGRTLGRATLAPGGRRFWDALAYSRPVTWGRELNLVRAYLAKNRLEAIGFGSARLRIDARGERVIVVGTLPGVDDRDVLGRGTRGPPGSDTQSRPIASMKGHFNANSGHRKGPS